MPLPSELGRVRRLAGCAVAALAASARATATREFPILWAGAPTCKRSGNALARRVREALRRQRPRRPGNRRAQSSTAAIGAVVGMSTVLAFSFVGDGLRDAADPYSAE